MGRRARRRGAIEHYYELTPGLRMDVLSPSLDERACEELARAANTFRRRVEQIERESAARSNGEAAEATVMLMTFPGVTPAAG